MSWRYVAVRTKGSYPDEEWWSISEYFDKYGITDPIKPGGETLEELRTCLKRMLADTDKWVDWDDDPLRLRDAEEGS